jgi:predicted AlkP superfamily phosphohydrolase/phosphomutase
MTARSRCLVIGLDGADPRLLAQWTAKGLMPNLAAISGAGASGILRSTVPPVTAPAWISLTTGQHPGSHGITGFAAPSRGSGRYTRDPVDTRAFDAPTVWEAAGRHGVRSVVVNVPVTWPPRPMEGVLVSGMLTPPGAPFTWPAEYEPELRLLQPDYRIDLAWQDYRFRGHDLVRDQRTATRARVDLCLKLLELKRWELAFFVFTGPDRLQHCLFRHVRRIHEDDAVRSDPLTAAVRDYFVSLDEWIGELVAAAGPDVNVVVVSDHGFGPLDRAVLFNRWLADEGLLVLHPRGAAPLRKWKRALNSVGVRRSALARAGRAIGLGRAAAARAERLNPRVGGVDWTRTRVRFVESNGFFVNRKGRDLLGSVADGAEYEAVRDDLTRRLLALRDPDTGAAMVPFAARREDVYRGRLLEELPDVLIDFGDGPYEAVREDYDVDGFLQRDEWADGCHRRDGLWLAAGPDIAAASAGPTLDVTDVAPLVLELLRCPVPPMDGRAPAALLAAGRRSEPK